MPSLLDVKNKLDSVSSCFCLAKWTTVTLHLESGTNHSCHHPKVHDTPIAELENNPSALHNTKFKIEQRRAMLNGKRPKECGYCWNIEDLSSEEVVSDRYLKSSAQHTYPQFDKIVADPLSNKIKPAYVEASFSNTCQFKCSYCSANFSSTWADELKEFGSYHNHHGNSSLKILKEEENPFVKAFWEWWPELKKGLHTFRITGGEPLLSPNTFRIMENLLKEPEPNLHFNVNSNLGAPEVLMNKFIFTARELLNSKAVKGVKIFTSIDAFGARAEYIRHGLRHDFFWNNVECLLETHKDIEIVIMCTFNALSITSFKALLDKIIEVNRKYPPLHKEARLGIDIAYLRHPMHMAVNILPPEYTEHMDEIVHHIVRNQSQKLRENVGFNNLHVIKAHRIREWMKKDLPEKEKRDSQADFYKFFTEHDRRRNKNFLETFPEMENFWSICKSAAEGA